MEYHSCYQCYSFKDRKFPNQLLDGVIHVILERVTRQKVTKQVARWNIHFFHVILVKVTRQLWNRLLDGVSFMSYMVYV